MILLDVCKRIGGEYRNWTVVADNQIVASTKREKLIEREMRSKPEYLNINTINLYDCQDGLVQRERCREEVLRRHTFRNGLRVK